ncbi:hypothetical protein Tco_0554492 [Tanacetum coccineum]
MESSRGIPPSKPSKSGKSRSANDAVEEKIFEIGSDDVDQTFDKKADDSEQPSPDANTKQPSPAVACNPKRQKNDWYKKSPSPEPQDPDWNTVKTIDDAQEQPWFKEKVNVVVPPLTFDELMSTPIDFLTFTMNHLGLTTLTREVLVGPMFNLLKGYDHPDMRKPLPLIEKDGRLTISVEQLEDILVNQRPKEENVKTGVRRRLDAEDVSTGFEDVSTGFTDIKSVSEKVSSGGEHIQAEEEAVKNARREELKRQDELAAKRLQEDLELSEAQKKRMAQVQEAAQFYIEED